MEIAREITAGQGQISVVIPTLNEAGNLPRLVGQLREQHDPEIVVVDGQSSDHTLQVAKDLNVIAVSNPLPHRAQQMNLGARLASNSVLYFVHADALPPVEYYADIAQAISEGFDLGCYRFRFDSANLLLKINSYFTRFDRLWCRGGDQSLFIKRTVYDQLDGFDEEYTIMEEYDLIERAAEHHRFKVVPKDILVSPRKYAGNSYLRVQWANLVVFRMYRNRRHPDDIKNMYARLIHHRG